MPFDSLAELAVSIGADLTPLDRGMGNAISHAQRQGGSAGSAFGMGFNRSMGDSLARLPHMIQGARDAVNIAGSVSGLFKAGEIQQQTIAFQTLLGSMDLGKRMMRDISTMALKSPFDATQMQGFAAQMLAAGFASETLVSNMKAISDTAAVLGTGAQGVERIAQVLAKIRQSPTLQGDELNQLVENRVPIQQIAEAGSGKKFANTGEAKSFLQSMSGEQVADVLLRGMEKRFGGAGERIATGTFLGVMNNLNEAIQTVMVPTGQALIPLFTQAGTLIQTGAGALKSFNEATGGQGGMAVLIGVGTVAVRAFAGGLMSAKQNLDTITAALIRLSGVPAPGAFGAGVGGAAGAGAKIGLSGGFRAVAGGLISRALPFAKSIGPGIAGTAAAMLGGAIAPREGDRSNMGVARKTGSDYLNSVGTGAQWGGMLGPWGALAGAGIGNLMFQGSKIGQFRDSMMAGRGFGGSLRDTAFKPEIRAEGQLASALEANTRATQESTRTQASGRMIGGGSRSNIEAQYALARLAVTGVG